MIRWLCVLVLLCGATFLIVELLVPSSSLPPERSPADNRVEVAPPDNAPKEREEPGVTARATPEGPDGRAHPAEATTAPGEPTALAIIPDCTLKAVKRQDVPAEREGKLLFIGTDSPAPSDEQPTADRYLEPEPLFRFLAVKAGPEDKDTFPFGGTPYRAWHEGDQPKPGETILYSVPRQVRRLKKGDRVKKGELVALVNPAVAVSKVASTLAKLEGSHAEWAAARNVRDTSKQIYDNYSDALRTVTGSIPKVDYFKARLDWVKGVEDEKVKMAAIGSARADLNEAATLLKMHEVRSSINGMVMVRYKNEGEAIKAGDPVVEIQGDDRLQVDGLLDIQEASKLRKGMEVVVEASRPQPPRWVLDGHLMPVTCVAVSKGPNPVIVSGGEDRYLRICEPNGRLLWKKRLDAVPRALACSPPGADRNLLLVGDEAGVVRLLDLADLRKNGKPSEVGTLVDGTVAHRGGVLCAAFRRDGKVCATGGSDNIVRLWDVESRERLYRLEEHRGEVTSVQFGGDKPPVLVTAGRDKRLIAWDAADGKPPVSTLTETRSNEVAQLGVSPDGERVLLDQGSDLRVLALSGNPPEGTLHNPSGTSHFTTLALFAPDGKTILTNGSGAGRLQLWRAPTAKTRASELRQFVWPAAPVTCGAFDPDGQFAVTGTQDNKVLVWTMPTKDEVENVLMAKLTLVDKLLETRSRQVRVWAELDNPGWLVLGGSATLVVPTKQDGGAQAKR
jgi:WD40 repeat protein/biotin carboxyl carrier protein